MIKKDGSAPGTLNCLRASAGEAQAVLSICWHLSCLHSNCRATILATGLFPHLSQAKVEREGPGNVTSDKACDFCVGDIAILFSYFLNMSYHNILQKGCSFHFVLFSSLAELQESNRNERKLTHCILELWALPQLSSRQLYAVVIRTAVPPYSWGIHSETLSGCQKPCVAVNPIHAAFLQSDSWDGYSGTRRWVARMSGLIL